MGEVVSKKTKLEGYQLSVHGLKYVIYGRITKAQRFSFDTSCSYKDDTFFSMNEVLKRNFQISTTQIAVLANLLTATTTATTMFCDVLSLWKP